VISIRASMTDVILANLGDVELAANILDQCEKGRHRIDNEGLVDLAEVGLEKPNKRSIVRSHARERERETERERERETYYARRVFLVQPCNERVEVHV